MRRRNRIAAIENLLRGVTGQPQLAPAMPTPQTVRVGPAVETDTAMSIRATQRISLTPAVETDTAMPLRATKSVRVEPATETDTAMPIVAQMGPVRVQVGRDLTLRWDLEGPNVTVPDTPERQAAAFGTAAAGMGTGWVVAEAIKPGYGPLGGVAGWWYAARLWNRWSRRS